MVGVITGFVGAGAGLAGAGVAARAGDGVPGLTVAVIGAREDAALAAGAGCGTGWAVVAVNDGCCGVEAPIANADSILGL
ncbi:hypothetical protein FACS1894172_14800 [Spirochaetia bacterium]|nr:hypothetical protein FACS1894172_14800 [Spirochaetia bacterium]